ncbi:MAG: hypothetical protein WCZ98_06695 [Sideroxydans sp.]
MLKKLLFPAALFFTIVPFAVAEEQANNCRLKGGSMVLLAADACVMEGGAVVSAIATPVVSIPSLQLSADPKLAAAQRAVAELLMKPVVDKNLKKRTPEEIERSVKFDGCRLLVDEDMQVDHGNAFAGRKHFKISSSVDMRNVSRVAFGELGKVTSYGGGLETYAIYFEERKLKEGNNIAISVMLEKDGAARKFSVRTSDIYWDAPNDDLWMADEYGYPKDVVERGAALDTIRLLFLMNTPDDAAALNKALGDVHAMCKQ